MPIYEYQCRECGEELEALRKLSDPPLEDCPACGKSALKKKVSAAAFRLKGNGWYETDFKTGDKKNIAGGSDSGASDTSNKPAAGAEGGNAAKSTDKAGGSSKAKTESKKTA
jgi:putative FmdB family regulatory protein